ncbi:NADPH:quinone reductase-like Zn-dependent oxidoreductase [Chryseobacterium bernardetii]|uniref:NADPH:quinone reductase-like Zn-dependent oxidoreductase n=2 Tax=Chryseobacterium TaxID=59732 RepID=A0A543EA87_9FLAO|nr:MULTISPECIES: NADP-dependent oxidoreductase [Chryseobacterium]MDR6371948.1 NADPH:quinone reductase-like Zn-dependent oxidoreductase [Chryseobacterium vietnamense]MDR6443730.1 NADPH:quinone reductase-like Zn-dependent oxidoreductase [Chryseobacterium bernardetii]TQM18436.1 NADPH:quinone reductase-like Zn-dependent oxidoreductase [Chryseobacterium aquifrigidense]
MKAVILNKNGKLEDGFTEQPKPKDNEVLIQIKASGFNPIDYQMLENELERKLVSSPILGRELSGIIVGKGSEVTQFNIGDEVYCGSGSMGSNGTYAEYIAVPEAIVSFKPKNISFEQAASIPSTGLTSLQIFNRLKLNPENTVLVTGAAGGVGSFLIKLLLAHNIRQITATVGSEENRQMLLSLGLKSHQIINYRDENLIENILKANNDQPFEYGIDLVGNYMSEVTAKVLKINGTYVDVTALVTKDAHEALFNKGTLIMNISNYTYGMIKKYEYYKNSLLEIKKLIENETILPPQHKLIGNLSLDTVLQAHSLLKNNQTQGHKLIMKH